MEAMRQSWTDERLDDFRGETARRFDALDNRVNETKSEIATVRKEMKEGFDKVDERFERIDERFERLHRLMVQFCGLAIAALIGLIATQL